MADGTFNYTKNKLKGIILFLIQQLIFIMNMRL